MRYYFVGFTALVICLIMLAQLIGGIGCLVKESEYVSFIDTAHQAVAVQIKWLDEQKFDGPEPPASLNVNIDKVVSDTHRIGRDGGYANIDTGIGVGGVGITGIGGDGGGGGGGGGGGVSGGG